MFDSAFNLLTSQSFWKLGRPVILLPARATGWSSCFWNCQTWFSRLIDSDPWVVVEGKSAALLSCSPNERTAPTVSLLSTSSLMAFTWSIFIVTNLNNPGFQRPHSYITIYHKLWYVINNYHGLSYLRPLNNILSLILSF